MKHYLHAAAVVALAGLVLTGCSTAQRKGLCPAANILASTTSLSEFRPNMAGDPAGVLYTAQLTGIATNCDFDKNEGTTDSSIDLTFRASRTPTGTAETFTVPYYVAALRDGVTVISKQSLTVQFSFAPGEATTTFTASVPSLVIRMDNGKKPYDYGLLAGLQLTQAQLDFNKKMGRYAP